MEEMQERFIRWTMGIDGRHRDDKRRDREKEAKRKNRQKGMKI